MKKGFTLIELLAVIVILAIIALIATPIILGIINDARKESNERSAELYASAVRNAIASYQLTNPNAPTKFSDLDIQYDGDVVCATEELYEDGSFYITDCTVNGDEVDYTYGEKYQAYKPKYYWFNWKSGNIGGNLPDDAKTTVAELNSGYPFYLGFDVDASNKVTSAYVCFVRNETEYCLKALDTSAYKTNVNVIKDAFSDVADIEDYCTFSASDSYCDTIGLYVDAGLDGNVCASTSGAILETCWVEADGRFECFE